MTKASLIRIERLRTTQDAQSLASDWNALSRGVPFCGFEWLESWWRSHGAGGERELLLLAAQDSDGLLVGLAPWYVEQSAAGRHAIRFLGSGEACSDYLTVLCRSGAEEGVALALADWLSAVPPRQVSARPAWDVLEMSGADDRDLTTRRLLEHLAARGNLVHRRKTSSCWRINLPADWETYLSMLSKSHRKQVRRLERIYIQTHRARLHTVETKQELSYGLQLLARLQQRRRESLGEPGCFASARFAAFHAETARRQLHAGNLRLVWLEVDDRAVAVEYQVLGDDVVYAYQSEIEPEALVHQPGRLITLATLRQAIAEGRRGFDFLRGDESYKAHWRAHPRTSCEIRVLANSRGGRLPNSVWLVGEGMKTWLRNGLKPSASHG